MVASKDGSAITGHVQKMLRLRSWSKSWVDSSSIVYRLSSSVSDPSKINVVAIQSSASPFPEAGPCRFSYVVVIYIRP
jgi:hypothetical protein